MNWQLTTKMDPEGFCLPRFSITCELLSLKAAFTIVFFSAVHHNYGHKKWILKHRNIKNWSKSTNRKSQTMTSSSHCGKFLFSERTAKMIDGSKGRKPWLAFELQSSRVFERRRNVEALYQGFSYLSSVGCLNHPNTGCQLVRLDCFLATYDWQ